jgi:hypothetical protein
MNNKTINKKKCWFVLLGLLKCHQTRLKVKRKSGNSLNSEMAAERREKAESPGRPIYLPPRPLLETATGTPVSLGKLLPDKEG